MTAPAAHPAGEPPPVPRADGDALRALLAAGTEEAARLLGADGAFLYLLDPATGRLRLAHDAGTQVLGADSPVRRVELPVGIGMFGRSAADRRVVITGNYATDTSFVHAEGPDRLVTELGIASMVVAPLVAGDELFGALGTFSRQRDAFTAPQVALVRALADHAALALANARLIDELAASREAVARQAEVERSLRELGTRISAAREPEAVVQGTIDEALRLLRGDGARIDIVDAAQERLRGLFTSGMEEIRPEEWPDDPDDRLEIGVSGKALLEGRTAWTPDYLADRTIVHGTGPDAYVRAKGIRSAIATPLFGEFGAFGTITVWSAREDVFGEMDAVVLEAIAGQAAVALGRARLIEELARSRETLARKAEAERALREIAGRLMRIQDPATLLQDVVDEAARLLGSSGAVIDLLDPATGEIRWAYDAGLDAVTRDEWVARTVGVGGVLAAIRERGVVVTGDYAADDRFADGAANAAFLLQAGIRSVMFAPLVGEAAVLGTLAVFSGEVGRFGVEDGGLLGSLADLATLAIRNAEIIGELDRSRAETARRAETERTLREIAARVTAIRDPDTILGLIVEETRRVLGSDGAHLTRMSDDRTFVRPVVVAGGMDGETRDWLRGQEFPMEAGINGLAASQGRVVWTPSYATDPRIPRAEDDLEVAERMGLGAMAAAPLRAPGGEVIGTLAVSYRTPGTISAERLGTLQALADHAAIALSNSDLLGRLEASERGYRGLVQATPDVIWRSDADGRFTFMAEGAEALFGWRAEELVGRHFTEIVAPESVESAVAAWRELTASPGAIWRLRFVLRRRDGAIFPAEVSAVTTFTDGVFGGAQGTLRDISDRERLEQERERLERELRESTERYRFLVENSPDIVFSADSEGRFTFVSESVERLTGFHAEELIGQPFPAIVTEETVSDALALWSSGAGDTGSTQVLRVELRHRDGSGIPVEVHAVGVPDSQDRFAGIHGSARDVGVRERLEAELRASEERYRSVIQSSPDLIWATNRLGRYVFVSDRVRDLLGWEPEQVLGRPFREFIGPASVEAANSEWTRLAEEPGRTKTQRLDLLHRDGSIRPFEVSSIAVVRDGEVENVYGIARDIAERERLERELRESEERYRFLVENSPEIVYSADETGRFTYISESIEKSLGWGPGEFVGRHFRDLAIQEGDEPVGRRFALLAQDPSSEVTLRMRLRAADGTARPFDVSAVAIMRDGVFGGVHGSARDIAERERLEAERARLDRDLRRQAAELAAGEERAHLARELHDSVTQALFSMTLLSRSIEILLERDPGQVPEKLAALRELQRDALAEMRALIFELRPGNIEENGLIAALRTHVASLSGRIGLPVVVEADLPDRPAIEVEEALYRIAQEALHNVVKHASAREVRVELGAEGRHGVGAGERVRLRVTDDGRGFDPRTVPDGHLGLAGMRARAERLHGTLAVTSRVGRGTTIEVVVPAHPAPGSTASDDQPETLARDI